MYPITFSFFLKSFIALIICVSTFWLNEETLICERYGNFLKTIGDMLSAKYQYQNAYEAYKKWGALRKVEDMSAYAS